MAEYGSWTGGGPLLDWLVETGQVELEPEAEQEPPKRPDLDYVQVLWYDYNEYVKSTLPAPPREWRASGNWSQSKTFQSDQDAC